MKKRIAIILLLVLIFVMVIFIVNFCKVRFSYEPSAGFIIKNEDETVEAFIFAHVYNGSFSEKTVTFEIGGGEEYEKYDLKCDNYYDVQIDISEGNARVNAQGNFITIPQGEEVELIISAYNQYSGDEYKGQLVFFRREAPEEVSIVIVK